MQLNDLIKRAIEIRNKYDVAEQEMYGKVWSTEQIMEGFVGDVGDLMKIVMAKQGWRQLGDKNIDKELKHELADCLWSLLVLSSKYGIDLEGEFLKVMDYLSERIDRREKH